MPKTDKYPALTQLHKYERAIAQAREKVTQLEAENRKAQRAVEAKAAALSDYYSSIGAGTRKPDPTEEARLREGVTEAQADTVVSYSQPWQDESGRTTISTSNPRIEGMLRGARERVERLEEKLRHFKATRFDDLASEISAQAGPARDAMQKALDALEEANTEWKRVAALWRPLMATKAGMDSPLRDFHDCRRDGVPLPIPASLLPEGEPAGSDVPLIQPRTMMRPRTRRRVVVGDDAA